MNRNIWLKQKLKNFLNPKQSGNKSAQMKAKRN